MRFIETIKNIWAVEELRKRILVTLFFVIIYRLGTYIVIPGIDPKTLTALSQQTESGLLALMDMFSGGALYIGVYRNATRRYRGAFYAEASARGRERSS